LGASKAASNAMFDHKNSKEDLVTELMIIAREELEHLQMVHDLIKK
jgi:tRNA-(ms[2]io[6]A)-hydroxylase